MTQHHSRPAAECVGVIGLGLMGLPIALNLLDRGFCVVGYSRGGSSELAAAGGVMAESPAEVAVRTDVLLSILPDGDGLRDVVLGRSGTLTTMRPGTVHIEMSTIDTDRKSHIRDAVRASGGDVLDSAISGTSDMVAPRLATTFVSGDRESVDRVAAVLEAVSGRWVYTGEFGTGTTLKYVANMLLAVHTAAAAEAMAIARRGDLDLELVQQALNDSMASSAVWRRRGPLMCARQWLPANGPITTLRPILEQIEEFGHSVNLSTPVFAATKILFDRAIADGWGALDISSMHGLILGECPSSATNQE